MEIVGEQGRRVGARRPPFLLPLTGVAALALILLGYAGYSRLGSETQSSRLEIYGVIPPFSFRTQEGIHFTEHDLHDHVTIANFIFTRCPTICPVFTMKMQRIGRQTSNAIQLVSFSVDPSYDTPQRLADYAEQYDADPKRWRFLTGEVSAVQDIVTGALKVSMEKNGEDENGVPDIVHGSHFVLLDSQGRIRGYYNSDDVDRIEALRRDAEALATQSQ